MRKQLRLKEEIAGLDPNVIIEAQVEGRPKRSTRRATRRNYVFDEPDGTTKPPPPPEIREDAAQLLQKVKEFVDSDSEYEANDHNQSNNTVDRSNLVEAIIDTNDTNAPLVTPSTIVHELNPVQTVVDTMSNVSANAQFANTLQLL